MRTVQLYVSNTRVELFNDEEIKVSSSVQNIDDISKNYTDFSQTFTVPASQTNNQLFEHYYNNDLDSTFNANVRLDARIEINYEPFRKGKVQLEGAEIKNGMASSYKLTFYGDVVTLKDLFKEDKLTDLDYSNVTFNFTGANVKTAIETTSDVDVRFPLISSERVWVYGGAGSEDISTSGGAIDYTELFPALKDDVILEAIETKYGVTFDGVFRSDNRWKRSFTWWKNRQSTNFTGVLVPVEFTGLGAEPFGDNYFHFKYIDPVSLGEAAGTSLQYKWRLWGIPSFTGTLNLWRTIEFYNPSTGGWLQPNTTQVATMSVTAGQGQFFPISGAVSAGYLPFNTWVSPYRVSYSFSSATSGTVDCVATYEIYKNSYYTLVTSYSDTCTQVVIDNNINFNASAPDIKVADWFSGILKEFNMVCVPTDDNLTYKLDPLEIWYSGADTLDITQYTDMSSLKVDRISPYKEINFKWEKSKALLNTGFSNNYGREYGDLRADFPFDGGKYEIKLPFENLLFQKFTGEDLQVSYCMDEQYKPYIPKPVKLYLYGTAKTVDFYLDTGSPTQITSYVPMGQDARASLEDWAQNFGAEQSSLLDYNIENSLYKTYYEPYLLNMFNPKSRKLTLKCVLPLKKLVDLQLEDRIVLRDKQYRINNMTTNLTTGLVDLVLVSDWLVNRKRVPIKPTFPHTGGVISVPVKPVKPIKGGFIKFYAPSGTPFTTATPTPTATITDDTEIQITIPTNGTGSERSEYYTIEWYKPDGTLLDTEYIYIYQDYDKSYLITEDSKYILAENLDSILTI